MSRSLLFTCIIFLALQSFGQQFKLEGKVSDRISKEPLIEAVLQIKSDTSFPIATDTNGFFSITLPRGNYRVEVTYVGYIKGSILVDLDKDIFLPVELEPDARELEGVTVTEKAKDDNVRKAEMGKVSIPAKVFRNLPVVFGETDILKTITLLPGIKTGGEGNSGIYVRGGGPDQNLVLLDGINIYNASHLLGFFSVFNGDVVDDVTVYKGTMPAQFGGRLSSVIDVNTRSGNYDTYKVSGGVGLISSKINVEGPIQKGKSSFIVSGRRTYADVLARPFLADSLKGNALYFYDINFKLSYEAGKKDKIFLTGYFGRDVFRFTSTRGNRFTFRVDWGNKALGMRWNHIFNKKILSNTFLYYNDYDLKSSSEFLDVRFNVFSGLRDLNLKQEFYYEPGIRTKIRTGFQYTYHTFIPGVLNAELGEGSNFEAEINRQYAHEEAAYVQLEYDLSTKWSFQAGYRHSFFNQVGPYEQLLYDDLGNYTGNVQKFAGGKNIAGYNGPEPRFTARYAYRKNASLKFSYCRALQFLHLATSSAATLPTDLWVPSSRLIKPQIANQVALGWFMNLKENEYEFSVETYYKEMNNQIEFKPGAQLFFNQNLEGEMVFGKGKSYGIELLARKNFGKLSGWIGYTLSWTTRTFDIFNNGEPYYYRYDRRHDISITTSYEISKKWLFNFIFVYGTGQKLTLPEQRFMYNIGFSPDGQPLFNAIDRYTKMSNFTMPAYHRADISFTYTPKPESKRRFKSTWNFSVYNIYNRANPYFIYLDADLSQGKVLGRMVYLFPIIPSVTWHFSF